MEKAGSDGGYGVSGIGGFCTKTDTLEPEWSWEWSLYPEDKVEGNDNKVTVGGVSDGFGVGVEYELCDEL
eukprot:12523160-Ditylum_brightwellii.AAC.1